MNPLTPDEIKEMRVACQLAGELLKYLGKNVKPGVSTNELDKLAAEWIQLHEAKAAPLGYHGFPKSICTSINEVICHGVPDDKPLKDGDMINIDVTVLKNGFYGDTSATFFVGEVSEEVKKIASCAFEAMHRGIEEVKPYATTGDIGYAVNKYVSKKGYTTVKDIGGHGIGKIFHDEPFVPSYGKKGRGVKLKPWCCITVEPMINQTPAPLKEFSIPGSSIKYYLTGDKTLSAQYEHTVLITDKGHEILTLVD